MEKRLEDMMNVTKVRKMEIVYNIAVGISYRYTVQCIAFLFRPQ